MKGYEDHGPLTSVLGPMPDVCGYKGHVSRLNLILYIPNNLFSLALQVILHRVAVSVVCAVHASPSYLTLKHSESVDVEPQFR